MLPLLFCYKRPDFRIIARPFKRADPKATHDRLVLGSSEMNQVGESELARNQSYTNMQQGNLKAQVK